MTFEWDVWGTPLMVLGAGAVIGAVVLMRQASSQPEVDAEGQRRDLERVRETSVEALRALETEKDKMDPAVYETERKALLSRGAAALRALEGGDPMPDSPAGEAPDLDTLVATLRSERQRVGPEAFDAALRVATGRGAPPAEPKDAMSPVWRGAITASFVWALVALLMVWANDQSTPRPEGGSMTGGTTSMGGGAPPPAPMQPPPNAPDFEALAGPLKERLAADPKDIDAIQELTQLALSAGDAQQAMQYNQMAAEIAPNAPDTLASKAFLAAMVGMPPRALEILEEALAVDPNHPRSLTYKGLLLLEEGRHAEAVPVLERAVELQPEVGALKQALEAARTGKPLGSAPPAPAPAPMGGGDVVMSGTIELAPGAKTDGATVLFLSVRSPEGGPPLAAKRLPVSSFPVEFSITTADAIAMGGPPRPFPAAMSISARLDADGNAMSREDLASAGEGGVAKGASGLKLVLQ